MRACCASIAFCNSAAPCARVPRTSYSDAANPSPAAMAPPSSMGKNTPRLRSFEAGAGVGVGVGLGVVALGFSVLVGAGFDVLSPDLDAAADAREGAGSVAGLSWETVLSLGATPLEVGLGSSLGKGVFGVVSLAVEALSALAGALSSRLTASLAAVGFAVAFSAAGAIQVDAHEIRPMGGDGDLACPTEGRKFEVWKNPPCPMRKRGRRD